MNAQDDNEPVKTQPPKTKPHLNVGVIGGGGRSHMALLLAMTAAMSMSGGIVIPPAKPKQSEDEVV